MAGTGARFQFRWSLCVFSGLNKTERGPVFWLAFCSCKNETTTYDIKTMNSTTPANITSTAKTLNDVLIEQISELYRVETQFVMALPKMLDAAYDPDLKELFQKYNAQAKQQLDRLEKAAELLGIRLASEPEPPAPFFMANLLVDAKEPSPAMDASLICLAYKIESYQKAGGIGICTFAKMLGLDELVALILSSPSGVSATLAT